MPTILLGFLGFIAQNGPTIVAEYNALKAAGSTTPEQDAQFEALIEMLDQKRVADWTRIGPELLAVAAT